MSNIIRIRVQAVVDYQTKTGGASTTQGQSQQEACLISKESAVDRNREQLCNVLNDARPGGLFVATADQEPAFCQVYCLKVSASFLSGEQAHV